MIHLISAHYTSKKLEPPFFRDLVDVFEDRIRYWMLNPAKKLLKERNDQIAAVGILLNYIEGKEIFLTGKDNINNSFAFFCSVFQKSFLFRLVNKVESNIAPRHFMHKLDVGLHMMAYSGIESFSKIQ